MTLSVTLGADHGGFTLKEELLPWLQAQGYEVMDIGAKIIDPEDDYPDYAEAVAAEVAAGRSSRGVIICGSGVGACIAANKVSGARAGLCHDTYSAHQGVEHDDMNILCLGARIVGIALAKELLSAFLNARFTDEERFKRRLNKILRIESNATQREGNVAKGGTQ